MADLCHSCHESAIAGFTAPRATHVFPIVSLAQLRPAGVDNSSGKHGGLTEHSVVSHGDVAVCTACSPWELRLGNGQSILARVSVVIPARNESQNVPLVFAELPPNLHEVILVDGSSTDGTVEVARELYPEIKIVRQQGRGKGAALRCGFQACEGDIISMLDADGSMSPRELPRLVAVLARADLAKGSRFLTGGGSADLTVLRWVGNAGLRGLVNLLYGTHYTDLCYGYIAFWRRCLEHLAPDCDGFEIETLLGVRAATAGLRVVEVASFEASRRYGRSKLRAGRDGWRVLRTILSECRSQPVRVGVVPESGSFLP